MANISFNKLVAGDKITYQSKNHWNNEYEEFSSKVEEVSENLIKLTNGGEIYRFKKRWCTGHYARNTAKLISVNDMH